MNVAAPVISVVIPAFNRRAELERALSSIWQQGHDDLEVVIVDDGSTDGTKEYLQELALDDGRIRPIFHSVNKGEAGARNTGVRSARGEFIAFLDSDDEWLPGKLSAQLDVMRNARGDIGACCTGQYISFADGQKQLVEDWSAVKEITDRNILILGCGVGMGLTFFVRRSVYQHVGYYDEELPLLVDVDWLCRFLRQYSVVKIDTPYVVYNKAPMRRADKMKQAVEAFKKKNKVYLSSFPWYERMAINSRFYSYVSDSNRVHGPWKDYVFSQFLMLVNNPFQSFRHYMLVGAIFFGLKKVGRPSKG